MCKLKIALFMIFFLVFSSNVFTAKVEPAVDENIKPLRIGFFIGSSKESFCKGTGGAITYDFACAISQGALDIAIVSDYVLKNLVLRKYTNKPDHILVKINFNLSDWDFYHIQDTQFFALVPHNYDNPIFNKTKWTRIDIPSNEVYSGSVEDRFPKIAWADDAPEEAKRLLSDENLKCIPYAKDLSSDIAASKALDITIYKKFDSNQLSSIFNPFEDSDALKLSQPCNVYMSGHGDYSSDAPEKSSVAGLPVNDMAATLLFLNDKIYTKSVRISTCIAGGKNLDLIQVKNKMPVRIKYLIIVDAITDAPTTSDWTTEDSSNVNLRAYFDALENFQNGYSNFVEKLVAIRAKKETADVEAMKKIKAEIRELEQRSGLLSVLSKVSLPKLWYLRLLGPNNVPQTLIPEVGWFQVFNSCVNMTDANILKALGNVQLTEIDLSGAETTHALSFGIDGHIEIKDKLFLLLYSEIVFANIVLTPQKASWPANKLPPWMSSLYRYFPSIPCIDSICKGAAVTKYFYVYPQIISMQHGDSINLFAKVSLPNAGVPDVQNGILNFLRDSFLILRGRASSKTFFIKELEGFNDFSEILHDKDEFKKFLDIKKQVKQRITLQNVVINTKLTGFFIKDSASITISFEFMGKPWFLSYSAKNLNPQPPVPPTNKDQFLWKFKESKKGSHEGNLNFYGLTYLAKLSLVEYQAQLSVLRDLFKRQTKPLKEFLIDLDPAEITRAIEESPEITQSEWERFEQQTNLRLKLKHLKNSLTKLKQKLELLSSKLTQLKVKLT